MALVDHYTSPPKNRETWSVIGLILTDREGKVSIPGDKWITLRLDGVGFSKTVRAMRTSNVLPEAGYSATMAECMVDTMRAVVAEFNGVVGYTQSDEMVVVIPPAPVHNGVQSPHLRSGRKQKWISVAAGTASSKFILELIKRGADPEAVNALGPPRFDCRIAAHDSWNDARMMLMWRTHDCAINGVSDAVYHCKGDPERKTAMGYYTAKKLEWLRSRDLLPLPHHQAYGTAIVRTKKERDAVDHLTGKPVRVVRWGYDVIDKPLCQLLDETMPEPQWKK